jgi:putative addiction module component (TIGR02574 family)
MHVQMWDTEPMSKPAINVGDDLRPEERLRMIEELWESLREQRGSVELQLTGAQFQELDRDDFERSRPEEIP